VNKVVRAGAVLLVPIAGVVSGYGHVALADDGNSRAAQVCPQRGGIVSYGPGTHHVHFDTHGECVSFFAMNPQYTIRG
jgi:hypothetical protein